MVISRYAIQSTVRVVNFNQCFYFGQKTANTFPKKKRKLVTLSRVYVFIDCYSICFELVN